MLLKWPLSIAMLLVALQSPSAATEIEKMASSGKQALAARQYQQAVKTFNQGLRMAAESHQANWEAKFLFFLGASFQEQAKTLPPGLERSRMLERAKGYYTRYLSFNQKSGAAFNNLAEIYAQLGDKERADASYRKALAVKDERRAFYAGNYAAFLSKNGAVDQAIRYYQLAAELQPEDNRVHEALLALYLTSNTKALFPYLWQLIEQGQVLRAENNALLALRRGSWSRNAKVDLLNIIVVARSKQVYDPESFGGSATGRQLTLLLDDPSLRAGIEELLQVHQKEIENQPSYGWWAGKGTPWEDPSYGVWPRDGFKELIRSLGDWCRKNGMQKRAAYYFQLAADLVPEEPDPQAYLQLADLFITDDRIDDLETMVKNNEDRLFNAKAQAYRTSHLHKIFAYHRALGVIYANIGRWGDERTPSSAIFQLSHAVDIADKANSRPTSAKKASIRVEPRLIGYLADGYEAKKMPQSAVKVRLDAADAYIKSGDLKGAEKVLQPLEVKPPAKLSSPDKLRLETLIIKSKEIEQPQKPVPIAPPADQPSEAPSESQNTPAAPGGLTIE
jgi:tetratricopeptide (TPR) repeat protein